MKRSYKIVKKLLDLVISLLGFVVTLPLFLIIAVLIKMDSRGAVLFRQKRVRENGKTFNFLKFRTMVEGAEYLGFGIRIIKDDVRITKIGKFLREWTLDELPQLLNILKGDMSLVGPRPLPPYQAQDKKLKDLWNKRLSIKPGLISIVDIKGRNLVSWQKRLEYDAWYVDNASFWLDLKILVLGFFVVLSRKGVYGEGGENKPLE